MTKQFIGGRGLAVLAVALAAIAAGPDAAGQSAPGEWVSGHASRARLVPGPLLATGERIVGVHIELDPGWHTYWRNPGASGVPPRFEWSKSANVARALVEYPVPRRLESAFGTSIGYVEEVLFPVLVSPEDGERPVALVLDLDYAACAEICVPLRAELSAALTPDEPPPEAVALVTRFLRQVPRRQGDVPDQGPAIERTWTEMSDRGLVLNVEGRGGLPAELFVEGPSQFYFPAATGTAGRAEGAIRFAVEVDGAAKPGDLAGGELTATLDSAGGAVEYSWTAE